MIRVEIFPLVRTLLLACMLAAALSGCAGDGRLDLKRLDFSKLKQPDWIKWDRDKKPAQAKPPAPVQTAQAKPAPATAPAAPAIPAAMPATLPDNTGKQMVAYGVPRPKPWRPAYANSQSGLPQPRYRQLQPQEIKEQVAKAPQGKVTSEIPEALAALPPPVKPGRKQGDAVKGGYSPDDLVGLDGPSVERLLGKPDLSRKEPFAEVWQYAHGDCVLFLFIYTQEANIARVSHAETGARDGGAIPEPGQCVGAILARHAQSPG